MSSKKTVVLTLILLAGTCWMSSARADYWDRTARKLGRGLANVITSPVEVPINIDRKLEESGPAAGLSYGTVRGVGRCLARIGVGVFEVLSFPFPSRVFMQPEFLFSEKDVEP